MNLSIEKIKIYQWGINEEFYDINEWAKAARYS